MDENRESLRDLKVNLEANGIDYANIPLVLQYNKRDLPNAAPVEYMEFLLNNRQKRFISFEADAAKGRNVLATLNAVSQALMTQFHDRAIRERLELAQDEAPATEPLSERSQSLTEPSPVRQPSLVA